MSHIIKWDMLYMLYIVAHGIDCVPVKEDQSLLMCKICNHSKEEDGYIHNSPKYKHSNKNFRITNLNADPYNYELFTYPHSYGSFRNRSVVQSCTPVDEIAQPRNLFSRIQLEMPEILISDYNSPSKLYLYFTKNKHDKFIIIERRMGYNQLHHYYDGCSDSAFWIVTKSNKIYVCKNHAAEYKLSQKLSRMYNTFCMIKEVLRKLVDVNTSIIHSLIEIAIQSIYYDLSIKMDESN